MPPLVISINMAKGLAVRVKVCASSKAVIGERAAKARYGSGWMNKLPYGIINEQVEKPKMADQLFIVKQSCRFER